MDTLFEQSPTEVIDTEHLFGIKCSFKVWGFKNKNDRSNSSASTTNILGDSPTIKLDR